VVAVALPLAADAADQASFTLEVLAVGLEAAHLAVAAEALVALAAEALVVAVLAEVGDFDFIEVK
jgi:hypothetical protein